MPDWIGLLVLLGFVTIILVVYMLITRSAGIYATPRQFWRVLLLSGGIAYVLSGSLFLFFHLNATVAVAVSTIVPFLVGNFDLGEKSSEPAPSDEGLSVEQLSEDDGEDEGVDEEEEEEQEQAISSDISFNHVHNDLL